MADAEAGPARARFSTVLRSGIAVLAALVVAYLGVAVAITLVGASLGWKSVAIGAAYIMVAILGPALLAVYLNRARRWSWPRAARTGAGICLAIHLLLLPVAVVAMMM